ncbi:pyridoxal-dependent decarboxylase, exosortase A system-associated [Janthinobacterium sp. 17J80-10]|uniref:pyridoxal-dependent decarboxylase, exosortase A system-associated n=1 Tax=Janthinobacterium sp. 17J80-10 TaxID=2497863 RepID=UPI0010059E87|nr:pyridoxal-dependent decarboxylase, exosortase A system-associated [Janthinobacterium sp. 17J80-10]QAU35390.1 pyridoxal-dependent decarboxylase, exosortase A system-associated [Janthinobacterium sp. 17J80-10]
MNSTKPRHAPQSHFPVREGCLHIGGVSLPRLAQRVGATPFYAYDRALLTTRVKELRAALPADLRIHYSIKANPMPAVVQHMAGLVDGLDVASAGELRVALDTNMPAQCISFAGPGKTDAELSQAIAAGALVHLESARELESVNRIGQSLGLRPQVMLRINPDFELKSSGMKMGGGPKQFGVDAEQAPLLLRRIADYGLDWHGLHIFSGSQSLNASAIAEAQSRTFELALQLAPHARQAPRLLNIGGGFGIPYFAGETALDLQLVSENLARWLPRVHAELGSTALALELGRYLAGEAGIYVTRVIDRKVSRGQVFLIVDGGMHHHLAASGNLGQVIRKNYPVAVGNKMEEQAQECVSVVGPLCTPLDVLAERMELAVAEPGDLIVVFQSGAYGASASPAGFLSHPKALEVLV